MKGRSFASTGTGMDTRCAHLSVVPARYTPRRLLVRWQEGYLLRPHHRAHHRAHYPSFQPSIQLSFRWLLRSPCLLPNRIIWATHHTLLHLLTHHCADYIPHTHPHPHPHASSWSRLQHTFHTHASTYSHRRTHPQQTTATPFVAEPCASCSPTRNSPQISPRLDPCASCPTKRSLHGTIR